MSVLEAMAAGLPVVASRSAACGGRRRRRDGPARSARDRFGSPGAGRRAARRHGASAPTRCGRPRRVLERFGLSAFRRARRRRAVSSSGGGRPRRRCSAAVGTSRAAAGASRGRRRASRGSRADCRARRSAGGAARTDRYRVVDAGLARYGGAVAGIGDDPVLTLAVQAGRIGEGGHAPSEVVFELPLGALISSSALVVEPWQIGVRDRVRLEMERAVAVELDDVLPGQQRRLAATPRVRAAAVRDAGATNTVAWKPCSARTRTRARRGQEAVVEGEGDRARRDRPRVEEAGSLEDVDDAVRLGREVVHLLAEAGASPRGRLGRWRPGGRRGSAGRWAAGDRASLRARQPRGRS